MIDLEKYDFLDIGCSSGGSTGYVARLGGTKGIGVTLDKSRIERAGMTGMDVVEYNPAVRENYKGKIRLSIISGHLERLESYADIMETIGTALHVTRTMLVIRSPWFDSDGANLGAGLKTAWSDKRTHRFSLTSLHIHRFLFPLIEKGTIARFAILGNVRITHSSDDCILPLSAERDEGKYDAAKHGPKPELDLPAPTFVEMIVAVARRNPASLDAVIKGLGTKATVIFDSRKASGTTLAQKVDVPATDTETSALPPFPSFKRIAKRRTR